MKNRNNVSQKVIEYININNISVTQIAKDTGIHKEKLTDKKTQLNATEFLEICSYLNLRPEDMR